MTIAIKASDLSRRGLLAGGMSFGVALATGTMVLVPQAQAGFGSGKVTPWVTISPDGTVTIFTISEMGQGSSTAVPLVLAEEMDADWSKVKLEWAPAVRDTYGWSNPRGGKDMSVTGSRAVMMYFDDVRTAGLQVRKILLANAAEKWGVDAKTLKTEPGVVINPAAGARLSYGAIAAFGTIPAELPAIDKADFKPKSQYRLIGNKAVARRDVPLKVNGTAQYAIDTRLPGMVYASALHAPAAGNAPEEWNDGEIKAMPGVIGTVKLKDGVAIAAASFEQAMAARRALKVKWTTGKTNGFNSSKALEHYVAIQGDPNAKVDTVETKGDAHAAMMGAAKTFRAEYRSDYSYHAQMEPLNATARFNESGDKVEVWDGSQDISRSRELIAKTLGFKEEQVEVHQCYLGGGFGRRSFADYAAEAALVARALKHPVKLVWTREEDIAHGMFRPQAYQCLEGALDASGKVMGWHHCAVGDDGGAAFVTGGMRISSYYNLPNQQLELRNVAHGIRVKHWRGVARNFNLFAIEGFVDELALSRGVDPVEFRLKSMSVTPKAKAVIEKVAQMSDWTAKRPDGRALGFAMSERSGSLAAGVVEASLDRDSGKIRVHRVWIAVDGGIIVTPDAATANIESGIVYGLSAALHERVTMKEGAVEQSNFNDYQVMRMSDVPDEMHVEFLDRDTRPTGLGEIGTPFIMPAVANAFAKLTGKRLYHMPFTPERVKDVLKA